MGGGRSRRREEEKKKKRRYFVRAVFNADCFYSQRRAAGCRAVRSAPMKDNLVFINFSTTKALVGKI